MDEVYEIPIEFLMAAGANGRQYELQSKSWHKVQDFLRNMDVRAHNHGRVALDTANSPVQEGHLNQALGADIASDDGESSSHMPV